MDSVTKTLGMRNCRTEFEFQLSVTFTYFGESMETHLLLAMDYRAELVLGGEKKILTIQDTIQI